MPLTSPADAAVLSNGVHLPWLGLGVFKAEAGEETEQAIRWAVEAGYRHIDTARIYENEESVGRAVRDCGVPRDEIFVTSKVWNDDQGYDATLRAFDDTMDRLGFDVLDLYLVHWPVKGKYRDTWKALERLYEDGRVRAIGLSNFMVHHLEDLLAVASVPPTVNQVEFHPRLQLPELQVACRRHGLVLEAWAPIMRGAVNDIPELAEIGRRHGKSPVQVTLRWQIQLGVVTLPKSVHRERILHNADIFDFELTDADMAAIAALDRGERLGPDPDQITF